MPEPNFLFAQYYNNQMRKRAVITGAFSFTGAAVAAELISREWKVHTLTNRTRPPEAGEITASPLKFDPAYLLEQLQSADLFINTYWVRIPWKGTTFQTGIDNSRLLVEAAVKAKVPRFVHVSVSRAEKGMNLGYYRGKNEVENFITQSGLSYGIVCPTLALGPNDVLTNNIAWFLRRFPFFPVPQGGHYRLQPVTLNDMGRIIADAGREQGKPEGGRRRPGCSDLPGILASIGRSLRGEAGLYQRPQLGGLSRYPPGGALCGGRHFDTRGTVRPATGTIVSLTNRP